MIKFKPNALPTLVTLLKSSPVSFGKVPAPMLQGLVNLLEHHKFINLVVSSLDDGLIIKDSGVTAKTVVMEDISKFVEETAPYEESILHKTQNLSAELRFYPQLNAVLLKKSVSESEVVLHDDEGNSFTVPTSVNFHSVYAALLPSFFPNLAKARKESDAIISASLEARAMIELKVGDTVSLRTFDDMAEEFGKTSYPIGDGKTVELTAIIPGISNIPFLSTVQYLQERAFTVQAIVEDSLEVVLVDSDGVSEFKKLIDVESGEEQTIPTPIRFSRLHLIRR